MKEQEKLENGLGVLNTIINETFCRHNDLTEEEYKEKLNAKESEFDETRLIRVGMYNILIELTKEVFRLQQKTNLTAGTIQLFLKEKENEQSKTKN
jgi:hypothetical protein